MSTDNGRGTQGSGIAGAYTFFAALYFVQSIGDPTSGLVAQPLRSLLRSWGESPASLAGIMALLALPWSIKPAFGLLSDFVPLFGSRRRNYLLLEALVRWGLLDPKAQPADLEARLGIKVTKVKIRHRDPVAGLSDFFIRHRPDLIVLSTHGREGLSRWLRGSVSEEIARHTHIPTLFI